MEQKPYCKPYCKLGEVLDEQARARHVRGPYNVAKHVKEATGFKVSGSSVSGYFYGRSHPPPEFNAAFVEAFSLEEYEVERLAYAYTLGRSPHPESPAPHPLLHRTGSLYSPSRREGFFSETGLPGLPPKDVIVNSGAWRA